MAHDKDKTYTVTDGVAGAVASETEQNWITHRSTSDTNFEYKYITGYQTVHYYRSGQNYTYITDTLTMNVVYHSASGLTQSQTQTTASQAVEIHYTIQLLNDSGGVRTYRQTLSSYSLNGTSVDSVIGQYAEVRIQNNRTLELKNFTAAGALSSATRYTYTGNTTETRLYNANDELIQTSTSTVSDNAIIRGRLPYNTWTTSENSLNNPNNSYSQTVEVVSSSDSTLVIRVKRFNAGNVLTAQTDTLYERFSR